MYNNIEVSLLDAFDFIFLPEFMLQISSVTPIKNILPYY